MAAWGSHACCVLPNAACVPRRIHDPALCCFCCPQESCCQTTSHLAAHALQRSQVRAEEAWLSAPLFTCAGTGISSADYHNWGQR